MELTFHYALFYSIVQTDESIVPILTLDNATQTEKELNRYNHDSCVLDFSTFFAYVLSVLECQLCLRALLASHSDLYHNSAPKTSPTFSPKRDKMIR